ncbi:MAG TPA: hypothetical protein DIW64_18435 [Cellvibrio sp.]|nr:hypothetical protein [Cellvibrio sp.]
MCKRLALIVSALGGITSLGAQAEIPLTFHVSGQAVYTKVKAAGENFSPSLFQFKGGMEFTDGILDGIGLQGLVAVPMSDAEENGLTLEIKQQSAAYITLTNPETGPDDLKVSILLGYASTEIETQLPSLGDSGSNKDTFSDFSYGVSLQDPIIEGKPFYWTLDYIRYYKDDNLSVDGLSLGVTYAF